ncbi:restriction modification system specificity subunit [Aromatoleum aromaticum EbN1]|uniref:Restriction modification system specificity subunit n=1 Tax=Aromatoleum aromaticum (strain DSM 19018 / LMG 30748 / EbN1) TaxID=76114 RepID=Q5P521_AROAE|nr:restriction endonuclease subunit S [Aromatoleum aromaticum]CAI07591.1 restriction modification system specificity subunit [Aromatoleum aromaticum EbN1]
MAKKGKTTAVPKLRFPEFRTRASWEYTVLGDASTPVTERVGDRKLTPVSISAGIGFVPQAEKFGRDISGNQYSLYTLVRDGDFVYNKGNSLKFPQGCVYQLRGLGEVAAPNVFISFRLKQGFVAEYFQYCFEKNIHGAQLKKHITSGARSNGLLNVSKDQFYGISIPTPLPDEQQKIADCLTSLDEVIAAQGRKVEAVKTYKRGLMQQLFPREGETLPRLRFPEFRDSPKWEPTTLDGLVDLQSGGTPSKINLAFWNGSIPWVSAKDMKRLFLDDAEDHISAAAVDDGAKLVPAGTVLMLTRGMTLLKNVPICVLRREMSFNQDVKALLPKGETTGLFVALLLLGNKQRLLRMVDIAGHGTGKLNTDELKALKLAAPKPAEQQRIADFLSSLDAQIAAEADKLAALKIHKDGLMQQLFPSPVEA